MSKLKSLLLAIQLGLLCLLTCCASTTTSTEIAPHRYYIGTVGEHRCMLLFDEISQSNISGQYFLLGDSAFTQGVDFSAKMLRRRYNVQIGDARFNVKLSWLSSDSVVAGSYFSEKGRGDFSFVEYKTPDYKEFTKRYQEECFQVKVIKDVEYGKASGFWTSYSVGEESYLKVLSDGLGASFKKKDLSLQMDLYLPQDDTLTRRPLLILIHGGAFYIGDKAALAYQKWCSHYASLGYVAVSLNYRMGFRPSKHSIERTGYNAVQDAHAATRFLVSHSADYGIDTSRIFVGGSSAGGITSLNLAFMRNSSRPQSSYGNLFVEDLGPIESSGNKIKAKFNIKAVANMWGAVNDLAQLENSRASIISFHGDADQVVPYDMGYPFSEIKGPLGEMFFEKMYGSTAIHRKARQLGLREEMHTLKGKGHGPHEDKNGKLTPVFSFIQDRMDAFFYPEIVNDNAVLTQSEHDSRNYVLSGDGVDKVFWKIEGGFILSQCANTVQVVWLDEAPVQQLTVSGCYANGAAFVRSIKP